MLLVIYGYSLELSLHHRWFKDKNTKQFGLGVDVKYEPIGRKIVFEGKKNESIDYEAIIASSQTLNNCFQKRKNLLFLIPFFILHIRFFYHLWPFIQMF